MVDFLPPIFFCKLKFGWIISISFTGENYDLLLSFGLIS